MSQRVRNWTARQFPFVLPLILLLLAWPWAIFGLLRVLPLPARARISCGAVASVLGVSLLFLPTLGVAGKIAVMLVPILLQIGMQSLQRPRLDRNWVAEQEKMPTARIEGDLLTIENFRHTIYRTIDDFDVQFIERTFDLSKLRTVDFWVVPFSSWRGVAHVFVSFGFADGEYLAVSVEARRQIGEPYSPVGGLFRQYEVIYVVGDERDLVGKRAVIQRHPVYLYPLFADERYARELLVSMLDTADGLAERPEFYHTVTNTCTSNVLVHAEGFKKRPRRYDFRLVFPGFADGLAVEYGLIEAPRGLTALREDSLINARAIAAPMHDGIAWSRAVREDQTSVNANTST